MKTLDTARFASPIGEIIVFADGNELVALEFVDRAGRVSNVRAQLERSLGNIQQRETSDPAGAVTRLARYFAGDRNALDGQRVHPHGTEFQRRVWRALCEIPAGETRGYGELAAAIEHPRASRAVGAANGSNPVSLFVPCHRVIAADGTLHGYGGGLDRKHWLLTHERATFRAQRDELLLGAHRIWSANKSSASVPGAQGERTASMAGAWRERRRGYPVYRRTVRRSTTGAG